MALSPYPDCAQRVALYVVGAVSLLSISALRLHAHHRGGASYIAIMLAAVAGFAAWIVLRRRLRLEDSVAMAFGAIAIVDPYLRRHLAPDVTAPMFAFAGGALCVVALAAAESSASRASSFRRRLAAAGADAASRPELGRYLRETGVRVQAMEARAAPLLRRLRHRRGRAADAPALRAVADALDAYALEARTAWQPSWIDSGLEHGDETLLPRLAAECRSCAADLEAGRAVDLRYRLAPLRRELLVANREWYYALAIVSSWHGVRLPLWFRRTSRRLACSR